MAYVNHGKPPGRKPKPFEYYIEKTDGCWLWKGAKHSDGYGSFRHGGRVRRAHHVAFEIYKGPLPKLGNRAGDLVVMHSCDNNMCVNPIHLSIGTKRQNTLDAISRSGGSQWASRRPPRPNCRKFDRAVARQMRSSGMTFKFIAKSLGVCRETVREALLESSHA